MCELFDWLPWGKPGCFRPIQASSVELMEPITNEVQDLGKAQVNLVLDEETVWSMGMAQTSDRNSSESFTMLGTHPVPYHMTQDLNKQEMHMSPI